MKNYILSTLVLFVIATSFAQDDITFNPIKHNPSFVGNKETHRIIYAPGLLENEVYFNSGLSYDTYLKKIRSGIGIQFGYPFPSESIIRKSLNTAVSISPKFNLGKEVLFSTSYRFHFDRVHKFRSPFNNTKHELGFLINNKTTQFGYVFGRYILHNHNFSGEIFNFLQIPFDGSRIVKINYFYSTHNFHFSKSFTVGKRFNYTPIVMYRLVDQKKINNYTVKKIHAYETNLSFSNYISNEKYRWGIYSKIRSGELVTYTRYINGIIYGRNYTHFKWQLGVFLHAVKGATPTYSGRLSLQYVFNKRDQRS